MLDDNYINMTTEKSIKLDRESSKREDVLIYRHHNYEGPIAQDAIPSKECKEYHENSCIQMDVNGQNILKRCGTPNSMET
jgi:hypothetical protein